MATIHVLGIHAVELMHAFRQIGIRRLHQQVVVVRHQAVGMTDPVESLTRQREDVEKCRTIVVNVP